MLLCAAFAAFGATWGSSSAVAAELKLDYGLSEALLGVLLLLPPLCGAPMAFSGAVLAGRIGTRRMIGLGTCVQASAFALLGLTSTAATPWVAFACAGLGAGLVDMGILTAATRHEAAGLGSIVGRVQAFFFVGLVGGGAVATAVLALDLSYRVALVIVAVVLATTGLVAGRWTMEHAGRQDDGGRPRIRRALALPGVVVLLALCFGGFFLEGATTTWTGVYLRDDLGTGAAAASAAVLAVQLGLAIGAAGTDIVMRHLPARATLTAGAGLAALGIGVAVAVPHPLVAALAIFVAAVGFGGVGPAGFTLTGRVDAAHGGGVLATVTALSYLAFLLGPFGMGQIGHLIGLRAAFGLAGAMAIGVALVAALARLPEPAARAR